VICYIHSVSPGLLKLYDYKTDKVDPAILAMLRLVNEVIGRGIVYALPFKLSIVNPIKYYYYPYPHSILFKKLLSIKRVNKPVVVYLSIFKLCNILFRRQTGM
jgi:hypothetical protein